MAGAPLFNVEPSYESVPGAATRSVSAISGNGQMGFIIWLALLGVILPVLILGGLKIGGFSFVFRNR